MQEISTRSPACSVVTALPVSITVPTASWPRIVPGFTSGTSPLRMCRSVPQIVATSMRTIASVGSTMTGSGTSSQARSPGPWYTSAFMASPFVASIVAPVPARRIGVGTECIVVFPQLGGDRDEDALRELDEPRRVAPLVVVPSHDLRLGAADHRRQVAVDRGRV